MLKHNLKELYSRHFIISDFSEEEQKMLFQARILVIGAGGLGSPVLSYLAAAGVGSIGIVDHDVIALSNLQRQIIYKRSDVGSLKVEKASEYIQKLNPDCLVEKFQVIWGADTAFEILNNFDLLIDCSDNISCRLTSDKVSEDQNKAFIYGAIGGWEGQVSVFNYSGGKTFRESMNINETYEKAKEPVGVIGMVPGVAGSVMAAESIKIILNKGNVLSGKMLHFSLINNSWQILNL